MSGSYGRSWRLTSKSASIQMSSSKLALSIDHEPNLESFYAEYVGEA